MVPQLASDARELGSDRRRSSDADRSQMIYRGQLLVRDCGASRKTYSSDTIGTEFRRDYRSEEHTSELQSLMRISYAVFCLKKKNRNIRQHSPFISHSTTLTYD